MKIPKHDSFFCGRAVRKVGHVSTDGRISQQNAESQDTAAENRQKSRKSAKNRGIAAPWLAFKSLKWGAQRLCRHNITGGCRKSRYSCQKSAKAIRSPPDFTVSGCDVRGRIIIQTSQKEILQKLLTSAVEDEKTREVLAALGLEPTLMGEMTLAAVKKAAAGDLSAMRYIRDTMSERPGKDDLIGQLAARPFETIDLSLLTDGQLRALAERKKRDG